MAPMLRPAVLPVAVAILAAAGCGGTAGDLLAVDRTGEVPGAKLRMVIGDGGLVRCNEGEEHRMPDDLLLDAREVERELEGPAEEQLTLRPGPGSILRYDVETPTGRVRFADDSRGKVDGMDELAFLVRRVAQDVCGLER